MPSAAYCPHGASLYNAAFVAVQLRHRHHTTMAAFTVYCDSEADATAVQSESPPSQSSVPPTPVRSNNPARPRKRVVIASYSAKENIHPRTGKRCVPGHKDDGVKRRAPSARGSAVGRPAILTVRTVDPNANAVKRMKLDGGNSKGGKGNGKAKAKASRLPRLSEEFVPSQLDIDIGAAYDAAFTLDLEVDLASLLSAVSLQEERKAFVKSTSSNPEVRDYVFGAPSNMNTNASRLAASTSTSSLPKAFSTPERQYIYSAFTFKTPSPLGLGLGLGLGLDSTGLQSSPTPAPLSKIAGKPEDGNMARFNF
ncbi:hypothetical protein C8F01DRAFT_1126724 [Mycena amicta]|nr:hypothetical protein C8F01DRAFT_1126724 [Mycena amicta]